MCFCHKFLVNKYFALTCGYHCMPSYIREVVSFVLNESKLKSHTARPRHMNATLRLSVTEVIISFLFHFVSHVSSIILLQIYLISHVRWPFSLTTPIIHHSFTLSLLNFVPNNFHHKLVISLGQLPLAALLESNLMSNMYI